MLRTIPVTAILAAALVAGGFAQSRNRGRDDSCGRSWGDRESFCEVREETIGGATPLDIDARPNGGIRIRGSNRGDVLVRATVTGHADTQSRARSLAGGVRVETGGGRIHATGPDRDRDESWQVSYEIDVPRRADLTLTTNNGGISIEDFQGSARFHGRNGGVSLYNVGGEIRGETTNGGVTVDLRGERWEGAGLDVETRNGGIRMTVPERYSAELEAGTTNGRVRFDSPITVRGEIGRHFTTILGSGGAKIRAITRNGGVTIDRR